MEKKRVLAIVGSPRRDGNTDILVDKILEGAREAGAEVQKFNLRAMTVKPCLGCDGCVQTHQCVIRDDMQPLIEAMSASDIWVFGTPVYYWGPTAQFKSFMDRWYGIDRQIFEGKKVIAAIPLGDEDEEVARHTIGILQDSLEFQGARLAEIITAPGVFEAGVIRQHGEILGKAAKIGFNTVSEG